MNISSINIQECLLVRVIQTSSVKIMLYDNTQNVKTASLKLEIPVPERHK